MTEKRGRTAAALIIGNELLSGKIAEANLIELAKMLRRLGIALRRVVMIPDELDLIAHEVKTLSETHDVLFTSGGVGPTHDDITMEGVAKAFGVGVTQDQSFEKLIRDHYGARLREGHLLMARVPEGSENVHSEEMPWPVTLMRNVWILPGVPQAFKTKLPLAAARLGSDEPFISRAVYVKIDEGSIKDLIDLVVRDFGDVDIGSYPTWVDPSYKTKVTFDSKDAQRVDKAVDAFVRSLPEGEPQRVE